METDYDKLKEMFDRNNIKYEETIRENKPSLSIEVDNNNHSNIIGYYGFITYFIFDRETLNLEKIALYE